MPFVRYSESVEQPKPDEAAVIDKIVASITRTGETTSARPPLRRLHRRPRHADDVPD